MNTENSEQNNGVLGRVSASISSIGGREANEPSPVQPDRPGDETKNRQKEQSETDTPADTDESHGGDDQSRVESKDETQPGGAESGDDTTTGEQKAEGETGGKHELPLDQLFEILKNSRRRQALIYLHENDGETTLSDLAEHIAAIENDTTVKAISSSQRKRVYVGLYQCHLPKMDDMGIIDFDQNRGTVKLGPNASQLDSYLDQDNSRDWHKVYGTITLLGAGLFALGQVGIATALLTPTLVLLGVVVGVVGCSLVQAHGD